MNVELQSTFASIAVNLVVVIVSLAVGVNFKPSGLRSWNTALLLQLLGWAALALTGTAAIPPMVTESFGLGMVALSVGYMALAASH